MIKKKIKSIIQYLLDNEVGVYKERWGNVMSQIEKAMTKKDWAFDFFDVGGSFSPSSDMTRLEKAMTKYINSLDTYDFEM